MKIKDEFCEAYNRIFDCKHWLNCDIWCPRECEKYCKKMAKLRGWSYQKSTGKWVERGLKKEHEIRIIESIWGKPFKDIKEEIKNERTEN